ncbi:hypothetical protein GMMP13_930009 [Candidatus Magnetomoraceae bacterium gMMP-13]
MEVFNAVGNTIAVITVPESAIQPFTENEIFSIRLLAAYSNLIPQTLTKEKQIDYNSIF